MTSAYIVGGLRTAGGRRNGALKDWHPADLAGEVLTALVARTGVDPSAIDDVIIGCVSQIGEQSFHIARNAVLSSSLPQSVPAVTIDRQCGSSQQALHFAAQAVMSGTQDVVIAGGVESMSRVPMGSPFRLPAEVGLGVGPWSAKILQRFGVEEFSQFTGAEMIARKYNFSRETLDEFALQSHKRAAQAVTGGYFSQEILPLHVEDARGEVVIHTQDEGVRTNTSMAALGDLKPVVDGGRITAGNSSQICDGASAVLVVNERALREQGLVPLARIHELTVTAGDPIIMLEEPIRATQRALERAQLRIEDIDLYEVNEAFAPIPLAWLAATGADPARLNVQGGAIALGHPLGASGTKLATTLIEALRRRGQKWGLLAMCEGGGCANVTIVEALN